MMVANKSQSLYLNQIPLNPRLYILSEGCGAEFFFFWGGGGGGGVHWCIKFLRIHE